MDLELTFPKRMTIVTVGLTLTIILGLGAQLGNLLGYITVLKEQHIPTTELSGMIVHVDDMLTDSTYLSLLTGQEKWLERYRKYEPAIEYSTGRFVSILQSTVPGEQLQTLQKARKSLFELEARALELGKRNKLVEAFALLDGSSYRDHKHQYTRTIFAITERLQKMRTDTLQRQHFMARITFIAFLLSLAVLITTGIILFRLLKRAELQRSKMLTQLARASKLASLGTLSSGIAHELRGPLTVVKGVAQHIEMDPKATSNLKDQARQIVEEAGRIESVTNHLRSFAREGGPGEWKPLNLSGPINRSLALLTEQLKHRGIEVRLSLDESLPAIWGQSGQLESVFQNLITNSRDAFESNPENELKVIEIGTSRTEAGGVRVTFKDTGCGMSPTVKDQIFDPFFSTKGGRGMGLGLSVVHGIIEEHRGKIEVETELGKHTIFILEFPAYSPDAKAGGFPRAA